MNAISSTSKVRVLSPYLTYVAAFVGASLVSGGVVHYPLNKSYYGALTVLGSVVFVLGAVAKEFLSGNGRPKLNQVIPLVITSLLLSFGIGMLAGGIQHFSDFPSRAAVLIPLGIVLSFLAYCFQSNLFQKSSIKKVLIASSLISSIALASLIGLTNVADGMSVPVHAHNEAKSLPTNPAEDHSKHPHND